MYLPEAHTDFILSIVGEELGFVGLMFVILGYASLTLAGMWISCRAKDKKGALMAFGATTLLALQALINLGVVSGALPTKGMPAPFISYGGSNMLMALSCVGLLLSVDRGAFKRGEWDGATV
jgi:cell division protein FtsW